MEPIISGAYAPPSAAGTRELPRVHRPEQLPDESPRPRKDEYVPEEEHVPTGLYWPGTDEEGRPKIFFDNPGEGPEKADPPAAAQPSKDRQAERCAGNTGRVDREIEKLRQKQKELKQRLSTETDEGKKEQLERQLAQVERELRQKDNDAYRRRHTVFSTSPAP